MKGKGLLTIVGVIVIVGIILMTSYNGLVTLDEKVDGAWAQVENQLKRRADAIPNLLETVKGYAAHEKEVIESISEARTRYSGANTPEEYEEAEAELASAVKSLNIIVENYPDLKANENFRDFQAELSGTENRIATERMRYNEVVQSYNKKIRRFPTNLMAGMFGFEKRQYFEINDQDAELPEVNF